MDRMTRDRIQSKVVNSAGPYKLSATSRMGYASVVDVVDVLEDISCVVVWAHTVLPRKMRDKNVDMMMTCCCT